MGNSYTKKITLTGKNIAIIHYENDNKIWKWYEGQIDPQTKKPHGAGSEYYKNGTLKYKGNWHQGNWFNQGLTYTENGSLICYPYEIFWLGKTSKNRLKFINKHKVFWDKKARKFIVKDINNNLPARPL